MGWTADVARGFGAGLFLVQADRCRPVFFRIGGEFRVSLPPPARRTDTCELRTARSAPRLRVARPVPGGGQVGCRTLRLVSAWRRFTTQVMYTTFSRIGEGNTTFLDPVAEDPIDSRLPVFSGCRHTFSGAIPPSGWWPGGTANINRL